MPRFAPLLLLVYAAGCTTGGGSEPTSGWAALMHADKVSCGTWPLREKDLQIDEITWLNGPQPGFLGSGLKRDASALNYFVPFTGDEEVDANAFVPLALGPHALALGGGNYAGQDVAVIAHNIGNKSTFDIRTLPGNLVKYKGDLGNYRAVEGDVIEAKGGLWLSVKAEDNTYHIVHIDTHVPTKVTSKALATPTFRDAPKLIGHATTGGVTVIWREGDSGKPFHLQELTAEGSAEPAVALDLPMASQLESWAAAAYGGAFYLAFIDGDTMIGQAEVKVAAVYHGASGTNVKWVKGIPLHDTHAQEPVFVATRRGLEVLILNWIDEESTIARYMVAGANIGKPTYSGIFPKGARILEAFAGNEQKDAFIITRSRGDKRWGFQLCKI